MLGSSPYFRNVKPAYYYTDQHLSNMYTESLKENCLYQPWAVNRLTTYVIEKAFDIYINRSNKSF